MLIAIMSDTFGRATENEALNARVTKLNIMTDYVDLIQGGQYAEDDYPNPWQRFKRNFGFDDRNEDSDAKSDGKEKSLVDENFDFIPK